MNKFSFFVLTVLLLATYCNLFAQVGIGTTEPDPSAMLDVKSTNKGVLLTRLALTGKNDNTTISAPTTSLLIYNTATAGSGANAVSPGFYYYNGSEWAALAGSFFGGAHYVGELYGGGVVFWVDHTGEHGLICSMIDLSTVAEWSNVYDQIGIAAQSDWNGAGNTTAITSQAGNTGGAANLCDDYTNINYGTGIYSDWYLPSRGELNHLWNNLYEVQKALDSDGNSSTTAIQKTFYWSSTEYFASYAWIFDFFNGAAVARGDGKSDMRYVRAVRAF
jgi:hypothetical protein